VQGRLQECIGALDDALRHAPPSSHLALEAHFNRGAALFDLGGRDAEAEEAFLTVISSHPVHSGALSAAAGAQERQGLARAAEAANLYARAGRSDKAGGLLLDLGHAHEAALHLDQALVNSPTSPTAVANLGNAMQMLGREAESEALWRRSATLFDRMTDRSTGIALSVANTFYNMGVLYGEQHRKGEAVWAYSRAVALDPTDPRPSSNLGNLHAAAGNAAAAEALLRRSVRLDPGRQWGGPGNLVHFLKTTGRYSEAEEVARESIAAEDTLLAAGGQDGTRARAAARARLQLGELLWRKQQNVLGARNDNGAAEMVRQEAIDAYRSAVKIDPSNAEARHMLAARGSTSASASGPHMSSPPAEYVIEVFDSFAASFDETLQKRLKYRAPELLADAIKAVLSTTELASAPTAWTVVDFGCGTGLCGPFLRPLAHRLVGRWSARVFPVSGLCIIPRTKRVSALFLPAFPRWSRVENSFSILD
jgi:predicted TPR repeat methyltransferase